MALYKYAKWSFGDAEALLNVIGEANARALIAGELTVEQVGQKLQISKAIRALFDKHGRRIPPHGLVAAVCDANRDFHLRQPTLGYGRRLANFGKTGLVSFISEVDFEARSQTLLKQISENEPISNLLKGVHLPVVIPQTPVADLGQLSEEFVAAAEKSYRRQFPVRPFTNYRRGELKEQVTIVGSSRYEKLIEGIGKASVVGIYFPNSLQGFSINAQREQMSTLPEGFILSGPLDTAMGWVMYPDILGRDFKTPVNDCSAVRWQSPEYSLCFWAYDDGASFDRRASLAGAGGYCSGGLLFVG